MISNKIDTVLFELREGLIIAWQAIRANKVRSFLTMLGIIIGISSVVLMTTAIKGIDASFQKGISALGTDVLYIDKWAWFTNEEWWKMRNRRKITMDDYHKFAEMAQLPLATAPVTNAARKVRYGDNVIENVILNGSSSDYVKTTNFTFDEGRFYNEIESKGSRYVAVVGSEVAKKLFTHGSGLDKYIKIGGVEFRVCGILTEQGSFILGSFNPDNQVFIPIGTIFKHFLNEEWGTITINVRAKNPSMIADTKAEAEGIMRKVRGLKFHQEDDFSVNQQEGLMSNYNTVVGVIQIAGLFITGLSLFVGAIGIMNIMFVSVKERTKEIGVRKAIGAKKRTILSQFLLESSVICLLGGLVGLLIAVIASLLLDKFFPTSIQISAVIIAMSVALITGIIAGLAPAYTAAKLDPVEALRYE
ncbi:MAG: ABC transporter permease [Ignavibacteria bacterium]|nr:ABC transporter permease [Ignavibacteria bacterium]